MMFFSAFVVDKVDDKGLKRDHNQFLGFALRF